MDKEEMEERLNNDEDPLEVAILKWVDILNNVKDSRCHHEAVEALNNIDGSNCALCHVNASVCVECVIYEKTGTLGCSGTPFMTISHRIENKFYNGIGSVEIDVQAEIDFLKSLRVPDKPKISAKRGQVYRLHCGGYGDKELVIISASSDVEVYIANGVDGCYWGTSRGDFDHISKWLEEYKAELVFDSLKGIEMCTNRKEMLL